jgi:MFS family permease
LLDTTVVNVALQTIRTSIHASEATFAWIVCGYALAFGVALIPSGRIGARYCNKRIFVTGLVIFCLSSAACGLAQNSTELVIARVVQGLGGGIFYPAVGAFIHIMFPPKELGRAFGFLGATIGVSTAIGPMVSGPLIQGLGSTHGWRSIFFVNPPVGLITIVAALLVLPSSAIAKRLSTDLFGLILPPVVWLPCSFPSSRAKRTGGRYGPTCRWPGQCSHSSCSAISERRVAHGGSEPLVPPHLFSHPSFTGGVTLTLVYFASFTGIFFTISLLWQPGLRLTALASGVVSVPFSIGTLHRLGKEQQACATTKPS